MRWTNSKKGDALRWTFIAAIALIFSGCIGIQPDIKYQPSNQTTPPSQVMRWSFDTDPVGEIPQGATVFNGTWAVRTEADAPSTPNALCQTGSVGFPALVLGDTVYADLVISTRFKPISGSSDQAAGLIFRVQDGDNYYILRANALEDNVNIYKYAGGQRNFIRGGSAKVTSGQWQELRVEIVGNHIRGFLNGQLVVEAIDDTYKAGKVGVWTKADSVTCFDDATASVMPTGKP